VQHHCHWLLPPWQAQFQGFRYTWCASHRRDARRCKAYDEHARCRHDDAQRSVISPHCLLQDLLVQRQSRDRLAQPSILGLKVLQPLHVVRLQAAVLASGSTSPPSARLSGSYGLSPFLGSQNINLPQRRNDPFRLLLLRHCSPPRWHSHTSSRTTSLGVDHLSSRTSSDRGPTPSTQ
jgi:hypothetical protein